MVDYASRAATRARRRETTDVASFVRRLDWILIGSVAALVAYGLWAIADITRHDVVTNPHYYFTHQVAYAAIGGVCLIAAVLIDPDVYRTRWREIFGGMCFLIAIVLLTGPIRGSKRWLDVGFFKFQPSEFGKVLFVLALAGFLAERSRRLHDPRTTLSVVGLALIPIFLVFLQPDFGSALVYCAAVGAVLLVAGTPWTHIGALAAGAVAIAVLVLGVMPAAGVPVLKKYQEKRLTGFLNPDSDPGGTTYNITQSKNAIGAGQLRGRGPENATQTTLNFLPEHHTDFVFASLAEERGFFGAAFLLMLYLLVVWRGLRIVTLAREPFSAIVAGGLVVALLFQVFVNVGMTMGIAPITGIPLPFVSVGGSSMIANLIAVGLLLSIHVRARTGRR
ncbi:MAG: rod shape-determining protein RodA [Actinobacteria bacterium]|nr:MAG: rod shape-determining protein RodA [Actinomycetota bacterium]